MRQLSFSSILFDIHHNVHRDDIKCKTHKREIELLCITCSCLICYKCSALSHKGHHYITIDDIKDSFNDKDEGDVDGDQDEEENDKNKDEQVVGDVVDNDSYYEKNEYLSRILNIWKSIKLQSNQFQLLKDKEADIANTFRELHEILRITEFKLLKPINDIKAQVSISIDAKIKEIQSLNTLVNIILKSTLSNTPNNVPIDAHRTTDYDPEAEHVSSQDSTDSGHGQDYQLDKIIDSIYSTSTLSRFKQIHQDSIFFNSQLDAYNNNQLEDRTEFDDYSILKLIQHYYTYYGLEKSNNSRSSSTSSSSSSIDSVAVKEILGTDDSIQNLKINPEKLEALKKRYNDLVTFETDYTDFYFNDNTPIVTPKTITSSALNHLSMSSNSVLSNDDDCSSLANSCNDLTFNNDLDHTDIIQFQQPQQTQSPLQQQQRNLYILSLGYDDGSVSLIDVMSNSSIEIVCKLTKLSKTFNSISVAGDYVYIFGGLGFTKHYHRYSIRSKRVDYQAEIVGVAGGENISTCFSGTGFIYLVGGFLDGHRLSRVDRFNIHTKRFERLVDLGRSGHLSFTFHHRGLLYIVSGYDGRIWYQSVLTFNPMTQEIQQLIDHIGFRSCIRSSCFDGNNFIYLLDGENNFIRVSIISRDVKLLSPLKISDYYSMVYHQSTNRIILLGGQDHGNYIYTVEKDQWIKIDHNDKSSRFECGAVLI